MPEELVRTELSGGVFEIRLSRSAKRNALSRALLQRLMSAVTQAANEPAVRVVTLRAEGSVFCAGMDLAEMQETASRDDASALWARDTDIYCDILRKLFALPVPTLAVVQGPVLAGGVGLVAACDLALASSIATVALPEPKRGITAAVVLPLLRLRVGTSAASWLLLSGESWSAEQARAAGLFHELQPLESLDERADRLTASILSGAPGALAIIKRHLQSCDADALDRALEDGKKHSAAARATSEAREGLSAFLEKRTPDWNVNK